MTMRARPKILVAGNYEEAVGLYTTYENYVLGVISDVRFPRGGVLDETAGVEFLKHVKTHRFDIPLLLTSSESGNAANAAALPAAFVDKNSDSLHQDVRQFFKTQLGFGDFVFRMPDGTEIGRASNLKGVGTAPAIDSERSVSPSYQPQRFFPLALRPYRDGAGRRRASHQ